MRGSNKWTGLALVAGLAVSAQAVAAEEPNLNANPGRSSSFGQAGQMVISQELNGFIGYNTASEIFTVRLEPSADYFLQQNLSVGASALVAFGFGDYTVVGLGVLGRVGYHLPLAERVSLWPKVGFGIQFGHVPDNSDVSFVLDFNAPVLFHLTPNFFIGAGPQVRALISNKGFSVGAEQGNFSGNDVTLGITTTVGGYF
ncbi:outer membrane beta-barrel protein [Corallococcus exiguus]|uniref:outer membrane beta-barrel protein n=1 Tax=Corallococcus TaxID=83461 RepID=UPI000EE8F04A|nr:MULTISPECIES: outer membrane beta-barrel protein [Corallococcus]NNC06061.1 outer membrane beta-barrel protein [Corallococcus exiguus]NNC20265.1 outer membrane beta-barrel protein [Corallococcus exiguus]NPC49746.1 outer membrane beta-barrel protein [Corallococcus exiguus]NRD54267.1 outer membrane beta-barrel protein [Corallococcus exiguus]NRD60872.1 outer membrane beta-barrel protein [Corallococcus exiguus]